VVGAGAGGVELLLAAERRLSQEVARAGYDTDGLAFVLVSATSEILPGFPASFRACFGALLAERGITIVTQAPWFASKRASSCSTIERRSRPMKSCG
jgi:selenide,water dikinase